MIKIDRRLKQYRNREDLKKYGQPDDILNYRGYEIFFWIDDYGQQMFTLWKDKEIGFGAYNSLYKEDMKYLIDKELNK